MYSKNTFDDLVGLISVTITQDEYSNEIETETERLVFADTNSVVRSEFYNAAKDGMKPTVIVTVRFSEYDNEKYLRYEGQKYKIERTYSLDKEEIELTCSEVAI